ncbi:MAG: lipopolysaccharide biosynthesis protein [Bacteroidales bacterium]|nr:lipopolysaccharide biosynthesis protein [Bacteroidales bacterium]
MSNSIIAKNTIFLYIRMLLTMAVTLYTSRVVLATLGVEDYGLYNVVGGVVTMFAFLNGTLSGATQRFITYEIGVGNQENLNRVFNTAMCIHWMVAILVFVLAETVGLWFLYNKLVISAERLTAALWVYQFSVLSTMVLIVSLPYNACIIAHEKMSAFAYISIIEVLLKLVIVYLLSLTKYDKLIVYAFLLFLVQLLIRGIYTIYSKRNFEETHYSLKLDRSLAKEMVGFTGWSFFGGLASVGMGQGINVLLNVFFSPVVIAARAIAQQVENAIFSFVQNFQTAMNPQIMKNYASNNLQQMHNLVFASCRYSYYLLFMIVLPIALETPFILSVWLEEVPEYTISFLRITMLIGLVNSLSTPLMTAANASGHIKKYQIVVGTILILIVPIAYVALKLGGTPESVLWIYLGVVVLAQCARLMIVRGLVNLSIRKFCVSVIIPVLKVSLISVILPVFINHYLGDAIINILVVCLVSVLSVLLTIYFIGINQSEREFLNQKVKVVLQRLKIK